MEKKKKQKYSPPVEFSEVKRRKMKKTLSKMPDEKYINPEEKLRLEENSNGMDLMDCDICNNKTIKLYPKGKCPRFKWEECNRRTR